jgi:ATP-dependent RNA helicase SUPV3L1/SUV3
LPLRLRTDTAQQAVCWAARFDQQRVPSEMTSPTAIPNRDGRGVLAILGPTNTGKTHLAIERMCAYQSGVIGLPLRLLAREVYGRVAEKVGTANVALVTGEEKINAGKGVRYHVCTVEAMPEQTEAEFVAIDEVQLAADLERGHIFTDRLLNLRGRHETMLLGAETVRYTLQELLPGLNVVTRPRMSVLTWAGQKKITRLPRRSAVVAFSADEVYAIAELIRRQRGGAAVVLGSLSPRTRNAQVALYQSGDVDFLVATDAIGMGLNLDLDHVAFAQDRKFDGFAHRRLSPAEMGQIAGRAGRHIRNGTFGVTGNIAPFDDQMVERLETHHFDPVKVLVWRNRDLDFDSIDALCATLDRPSANPLLMKSFPAPDRAAVENLARDKNVVKACDSREQIRMLWDVCQIPDYRRISPAEHAELLRSVFQDICTGGKIDQDWFARQVERTDRTEGDIDALSARIAQVRTWTYISNRETWLADPRHWQELTRQIEDRLSDALHENLTKRFIDRRTSVLMKRLRENAMLDAEISENGDVVVEGHHVGQLLGFRFTLDAKANGPDAKAANAAAMKALAAEIGKRAERLRVAANADIVLDSEATLRWRGEPVAKLSVGENALKPRVVLLADEQLTGAHREIVAWRLERWAANHISTHLKPLVDLAGDEALANVARGVAYRIVENFGVVDRREIASELRGMDQDMRASLRKHGVRFGAYHVFVPGLLKPAPAQLICQLWSMKRDKTDVPGLSEIPAFSSAGRTSFPTDSNFEPEIYRICGFRPLGAKAVRIDILERLADLIRPAMAWQTGAGTSPPDGAAGGRAFYVTPAMLSILGATHEDMEQVLNGLGYLSDVISHDAFAELKARIASEAPRPAVSSFEPVEQPGAQTTPMEARTDVIDNASTDMAAVAEAAAETAEGEDQPEFAERPALLWHLARHRVRAPARHGQEKKPRGAGQRDGPARSKGAAQGKASRTAKGAEPHRPGKAKREKFAERGKIDPDSPFAKLVQLKEALEKRDGQG